MNRPVTIQISLDVDTIDGALLLGELAVRAGVDWLEAGTGLLLSEGTAAVTALRRRFPNRPLIADTKTMDGGYGATRRMARAGASMVVVMAAADPAVWHAAVRAGAEFDVAVMADLMYAADPAATARALEDAGIHYIVLHTGYDERTAHPERSPLDALDDVVASVDIPVQVVGGLTAEEAASLAGRGAPFVVLGTPVVAFDLLAQDDGPAQLEARLRGAVDRIRGHNQSPTGERA